MIKIWGRSIDKFYTVGYNGNFDYFNGRNWEQILTGTQLPFRDIWGGYNPFSKKQEVVEVTTGATNPASRLILEVKGNRADTLSRKGLPFLLDGIWFKPGMAYYVVGAGIFYKRDIHSHTPWQQLKVNQYFSHGIRANDINDVVVVGAFGEIVHFNGISWKNYTDELGKRIGYEEVQIKNDIIVAVGDFLGRAVITVGRRH
jgi:hypothetical protein